MLFDVDGTLADTESQGHLPAYNEAFRELSLGFRWSPDLYRQLLAQPGGRERIAYFLSRYRPDLGDEAESARADQARWIDKVHALKSRYFRRYVREGRVPLRSGVLRLIEQCASAGVKVALVTNASPASLDALLRHALPGLTRRINTVVCGGDVAIKKPAPDAYHLALRRLGVAAAKAVAVEDSAMGLQAATAAGLTTLITRNQNTLDHEFSAASLVLDGLGEPDAPARIVRGRLAGHCLTLQDLDSLLASPRSRCAA